MSKVTLCPAGMTLMLDLAVSASRMIWCNPSLSRWAATSGVSPDACRAVGTLIGSSKIWSRAAWAAMSGAAMRMTASRTRLTTTVRIELEVDSTLGRVSHCGS